jgi:hypothetical protein
MLHTRIPRVLLACCALEQWQPHASSHEKFFVHVCALQGQQTFVSGGSVASGIVSIWSTAIKMTSCIDV